MTILDANGADLLSIDDHRNIGFASPSEGWFRKWADEMMRNSSQGYHYPIRRGYRGKLRFKYTWDYFDENQNILLDVTIPWRTDDALD